MRFSQPCLAAVCFASCGLLVPTIQPSTIMSWHQVNKSPLQCVLHCRLPLVSTVLLSVASTWVSAQLTVSASPLAGMTMAPHLEGHEIAFNASDRKSWKKYARSMDEYLKCESSVIVRDNVKVGGLMSRISLFQMKRACSELILRYLYPIFPFGSCRACWERKPLCGQSAAIECVFFFHALLLSALLNQRPEAGRALL